MGVWIEIFIIVLWYNRYRVTPCVGVWIEIVDPCNNSKGTGSLPAWECGLKYTMNYQKFYPTTVTPCVGVWIEIKLNKKILNHY